MAKRKWFPHALTASEHKYSADLFQACTNDLKVRRKRWNEYVEFCDLNHLDINSDVAFFDYVSQLVCSNIRLGGGKVKDV